MNVHYIQLIYACSLWNLLDLLAHYSSVNRVCWPHLHVNWHWLVSCMIVFSGVSETKPELLCTAGVPCSGPHAIRQ